MELRGFIEKHWGIFPTQIQAINEGLINQTWLVRCASTDFILQQINTIVFKDPQTLQGQLQALSEQIKLSNLVPLAYVHTHDQQTFIQTDGKTYRLLRAITPSVTLTKVSADNARLAAKALLEFHTALAEMNPGNWIAPIDHFLDVSYRIEHFEKALKNAESPKLSLAQKQIASLQENEKSLNAWRDLLAKEPKVLIHADPKLSNFLFHPNGKQVRALIDWDTIQLGSPYYDYADMLRSFCSWGEDVDENEMLFRPDVFESLMESIGADQSKLLVAIQGVILVQAMRFLTDFLQNDVYYKVNDDLHNLRRTKNQLRLVSELKAYWLTTRRRGL
jgi:thiamine kinase-like enzyme